MFGILLGFSGARSIYKPLVERAVSVAEKLSDQLDEYEKYRVGGEAPTCENHNLGETVAVIVDQSNIESVHIICKYQMIESLEELNEEGIKLEES